MLIPRQSHRSLLMAALVVCLFAGAMRSLAVEPVLGGRPAFQVFGDEHGLPQMTVLAIARDRRGDLWVGTQDGAARYDGKTWHAVDMPEPIANYVQDLLPARDGGLWLATESGLARLGDAGWQGFDRASTGLPSDVITALAETAEGVWVGTPQGLARFDGGRWEVVAATPLPAEGVTRLAVSHFAAQETLWVGTRRGLVSHRGGRWSAEAAELVNGRSITALVATAEGLWVGVEGDLLHRDPAGTWRDLELARGGFKAKIQCLAVTHSARETVWIGADVGLFRLSDGVLAGFVPGSSDLPSESVTSLATTSDGQTTLLWVGLASGGVARAVLEGWSILDKRNAALPRNDVYAFLETGPAEAPEMWFGTEAGLARWRAGAWSLFTHESSGLPDNVVNGLLETRENGRSSLWVATDHGLGRLVDGRWSRLLPASSSLPGERMLSLLQTRDATLWVGTDAGLAGLGRDGRWTVYRAGDDALPDGMVYALAETFDDDRPSLWAGTRRGGLARLRDGVWTRFDRTGSQLPDDWVNCLLPDVSATGEPVLWVGTDGGAVRLDPRDPARPWLVLTETTTPALPDDVVYQIRKDPRGRTLLFTNRGVARWSEQELAMEHLTTADGLPGNGFTQWGSMVDRQGRIWAGSVRGVAIYDQREVAVGDGTPLRLRLTEILVDGQPVPRAGADLELRHDEGIAIHYALTGLFRSEENRFRRQLVGLERAPSGWTPAEEQTYTHLPAGDYVFRVWGRDFAGREAAAPAELAFSVRPAPWATGWAWAVYVLVLTAVAYFGLQSRDAAMRWRQAQLETAVRERTESLARSEAAERQARAEAETASRVKGQFLANMSHELRTPLNAVIGMSSLLAETALDAKQRTCVETIRGGGEALLAMVGEILDFEKLEAGKVELDETPLVLAEVIAEAVDFVRPELERKQLAVAVEIDCSVPASLMVDRGRLRQVLLNLLGNAVKFTGHGRVTVEAEASPLAAGWWELRVAVRDTGIGIPDDKLGRLFRPFSQVDSSTTRLYGGTGLGLAICKALVERMRGAIGVESRVGEGSRFFFSIVCQDAPAAFAAPAPAGLPAEPPPAVAQGLRVLLAEDNAINQRIAVLMLEYLGCVITLAGDGREAVSRGVAEPFDVIFLDLQMPVMDGFEAAKRLCAEIAEDRRPALVAMTADVRAETRERCQRCGMEEFLGKPVKLDELRALLVRLGRR